MSQRRSRWSARPRTDWPSGSAASPRSSRVATAGSAAIPTGSLPGSGRCWRATSTERPRPANGVHGARAAHARQKPARISHQVRAGASLYSSGCVLEIASARLACYPRLLPIAGDGRCRLWGAPANRGRAPDCVRGVVVTEHRMTHRSAAESIHVTVDGHGPAILLLAGTGRTAATGIAPGTWTACVAATR